ncbi:TonB-dependent receptor domain-containing protein [Rhizorhabdus histidinilytica]
MTGRGGARFKLTPDVNLFVAYGVGKRPETLQINPTRPADLIPEERLDSVEGGIKFRLFGGRVVGDATLFHYEYENFQTQGLVNGRLATVNAGKADATGFETQLNVALTRELSIFGSYGYNKARLRSGAFKGNRFRNSPDHKSRSAPMSPCRWRADRSASRRSIAGNRRCISSTTTTGSTCSSAFRSPSRTRWWTSSRAASACSAPGSPSRAPTIAGASRWSATT